MKFPLQIPNDESLILTQGFGPSNVELEPPGPNGEPHFHYGVDIIRATPVKTYGTAIICPAPYAYVSKETFTTPMSQAGNGVTIGFTEGGTQFLMVAWHMSEAVNPVTASFKEGDVIGYVGNSGKLSPTPTASGVWAGAHLHLGLCRWNGAKWEYVDPLTMFDINNPYRGPDTDFTKDLPPLQYFLTQALDTAKNLAQQVASYVKGLPTA